MKSSRISIKKADFVPYPDCLCKISGGTGYTSVALYGTFEMDFDPDKLMHILTNLVSNALKYTPEGGRI